MRDQFVHKLNKGLKSLRLPLGYLSIFALAGIEPRKEIRLQVFEQNDLADFNINFLLLQLLLGRSILNYYEHTCCCVHVQYAVILIVAHIYVHTESSVDAGECGEEEGVPKTTFESKRLGTANCIC